MSSPLSRGSDTGLEHGTASAYSNRGCRCRPCKDAWAASVRDRKLRRGRIAAKTPAPTHTIQRGTGRPLTVWRCSCGEISIGTPTNPYSAEPERHQFINHQWTPLSQREAEGYLNRLTLRPISLAEAGLDHLPRDGEG